MDSTATFMATKLSPMRMAARTRAPSTSSVAPLPLTVPGRSNAFVPSASRRLLSPFALLHRKHAARRRSSCPWAIWIISSVLSLLLNFRESALSAIR